MSNKRAIQVTAEVIATAVPTDSGHCMIADALKEATPNARRVAVDLQTIRYTDVRKNVRYTFLTPRPCQLALVAFDRGANLEPFAYRLGPPIHEDPVRTRVKVVDEAGNVKSKRKNPAKRTVRKPRSPGSVPTIVGGSPLPTNPTLRTGSGNVRTYGMRSLQPNAGAQS